MAATSRCGLEQECREFTRLLQSISNRLTKENLSQIKLFLSTEKMLNIDTLDEIKFNSDAFYAMGKARLITEYDCSVLISMLSVVGRTDLRKETEAYQAAMRDKGFDENDAAASAKSESSFMTSMEAEEESQPSSQESSVSMTDEQKLRQMTECDSQDLFDDDDN